MKITKIGVFRKDLPYCGGGLAVGDRTAERTRTFDTFNSTVVVIDTDVGISGCGELRSRPCPVLLMLC
jgi:L-alanine-DL-glutamate epimerase-like enolase superfamily enzyme